MKTRSERGRILFSMELPYELMEAIRMARADQEKLRKRRVSIRSMFVNALISCDPNVRSYYRALKVPRKQKGANHG